VVENQSSRWTAYVLALIVLLFAIFGFLLWRAGLFRYDGTEPSAKAIAASLALAGALVGSLVSIVGIVLKHSLDLRTAALNAETERRLGIDAERTSKLQGEAERRLTQEATIEAAKLLGSSSKVGALFALSSLGMHDLATVLTGHLLAMGRVDANSAAWLLDRTLKTGEPLLQNEAAYLLEVYVHKFLMPNGKGTFPSCILNWDLSLPSWVRQQGARALGYLLAARPYSEWDEDVALSIMGTFGSGWATETDQLVKNEIGVCLKSMLAAAPKGGALYYSNQPIPIDEILSEVRDLITKDRLTQRLVEQLDKWAGKSSIVNHR
jgi:hypothetical protein